MDVKVNNIDAMLDYLEFGMRLSAVIRFGPKDEYSFQCNLIGIKLGKFILLDLRQKTVEDLITRKTSNVPIIIRGITNTELGHILAFESQVITITSRPTWLMFIQLPRNYETKPVRSDKRLKLTCSSLVTHSDVTYKGTLCDLSISGCGIYFDVPIKLEKESQVVFEPSLESFQPTKCNCQVVNVKKFRDGHFVGLKFVTPIEISDDLEYEVLQHMQKLQE